MTTERSALAEAYLSVATPADQLPYSPQMEALVREYSHRLGHVVERRKCWLQLLSIRKCGQLPRLRS